MNTPITHHPRNKAPRISSTVLSVLCVLSVLFFATAKTQAEQPPEVEQALANIAAFKLGDDSAICETIRMRVLEVQGDLDARNVLANRLAALLGEDSTFDCKRFVCKMLIIIATEQQLPALAPMLENPELAHLARMPIENIPGAAADKVLLDALCTAEGPTKAGILASLGARAKPQYVAQVAPMLADPAPVVGRAAAETLGAIATPEAADILLEAMGTAGPSVRPTVIRGLIACAHTLREAEQQDLATRIYTRLYEDDQEEHIRFAAFDGLVALEGAAATARVCETIANGAPVWQRNAMAYVRTVPGGEATTAFVALYDSAAPETQALLVAALGDRGDQSALPVVKRAAESSDPGVRLAALKTLGQIGDASVVLPLATMAARVSGDPKRAARTSLLRMPGEDVDQAIGAALGSADPDVQTELLRAAAGRSMTTATEAILELTGSADADVRDAAFHALGSLATVDGLAQILDRLLEADDPDIEDAAVGAYIEVARRVGLDAGPVDQAVAAFNKTRSSTKRVSLIRVLSELHAPASLDALRKGMAKGNSAVRLAAIDALAQWPQAAPRDDLREFASKARDDELRDAAVNAFLLHIRRDKKLPAKRAVGLYEEALALTESVAVLRNILSGLSEIPDKKALEVAERYLADERLGHEAAVAVERIRKHFYTATASLNAEAAGNAFDGKIASRWDTGAMQRPGQWFQLDMGGTARIRAVVLDASGSPSDFPRGYAVHVFDDPENIGDPVAQGSGEKPVHRIAFDKPATGRYLRVVQTGRTDENFWSIHELRVLPR